MAITTLLAALLPVVSVPDRAWAVIPDPTPTTSVINVNVGGVRDNVSGVTPLPGVQLGLYTTETGGTQITTCTSDADGDCNFIVAGTGDRGTNRGIRPWIRQLSVPTGWYDNPQLRTGDANGTGSAATDYRFQTPALYGGQTSRFASFAAGGNSTPKASGGIWQNSLNNPVLPSSCGLDVALVLDLSGSISGQLGNLKTAANTFTDALVGTPSRMSLFSFATASPAAGGDNYPSLTPVSTPAQATAFKARYAGWTAGGNTNWDRGLAVPGAAVDEVDVAVMITDGNPSVSGLPAGGPGGNTRFKEVEAGIFSANLLKLRGTRVLAVGVGSGVTGVTGLNLASISGPTRYTPATPNEDVADYYQSTSFTEVGTALRNLALGNCAGSISVTKQIVPPTGTVADAEPAGPGWVFDATGSTGVTVNLPTQRETTGDLTGTVNFPLTFTGGTSQGPVTIQETQQTDYSLVTVAGQNAVCTNLSTGASVAVTNAGTAAQPGFTADVPNNQAVGCSIYNRAPEPPASIQIDKRWVINGVAYDNGEQPDGFQAELSITGPGDDPASPQDWGVPRPGYAQNDQPVVDETTEIQPELCTLDSATITGPGVQEADLPWEATLAEGDNEFTVTNTVTCRSELTLVKQVLNGIAEPEDWRLTATGQDGSLPGPNGTTGVTAEVTPGVDYTLAEFDGDPNYEQEDVDLDPVTRPWLCVEVDVTRSEVPGYVDGSDATVAVALGARVVCTAYNQTATLGLRKVVENRYGGSAVPSDWTLTATPINPPVGVVAQEVTGSDAFQTLYVRPDVTYRITESGGPDGYTRSVTCDIVTDNPDGDPEPRTDNLIAVPALETGECTVTNRDAPARLTLVKEVLNGNTGGTSERSDWTLTAAGTGVGATTVTGRGGSPEVMDRPVPTGTYQLSEDGPAGYESDGYRCTGSDAAVTEVTLALGEVKTCTVVNRARQAYLTLVKEVDGGSRGAADWTLRADGPRKFEGITGTTEVTMVPVPPGRYRLSEVGPTDYAASDWNCQNGTEAPVDVEEIDVPLGGDVRCTITNTFAPQTARLTLVKEVEDRGGGTAQPTDWVLAAAGPENLSGRTGSPEVTQVEVPAGRYELSESGGPDGYAASNWRCQNRTETPQSTQGPIDVAVGSDVRCVITNSYVDPALLGSLTLVKVVDNTGGGAAQPTDWILAADGPRAISGRTGSTEVTSAAVLAGRYQLSESDGPSDYRGSDWNCQNGTDTPITTASEIEIPRGAAMTCIVTNRYDPPNPPVPPNPPIPPIPPLPPFPPLPPTGGPGFWPLVAGILLVVAAGVTLLLSRVRSGRRTH